MRGYGAGRGLRLAGMTAALSMPFTWMPGMAWADAAPSGQVAQATVNFDIPAQGLSAALTLFGRQAGLQISFDPSLVGGMKSQAVQGAARPDEALARLLSGTGLGYRHTDTATILIEKLPQGAGVPVPLPSITVEGAAETAIGPVEGYVAERSATGTKTDTPLVETPQTVNVITRDQIEAQGAESVPEALRYTPGVVSEPRGIQSYADTLYSRGFAIDEYWDGQRLLVGNFAQPQIDEYNLERVEVLKGPGSVLYGQASPGGVANLVSKRPTPEPYHEVQLVGGNHDHFEGGFDFGGPLDKDGKFLYRLTGLGRDTGTQVRDTEEERFSISPAFTWQPNDRTSLTVLTNFQADPKGGYSGFLPADGTVRENAQGKRFSQSFFDGNTGFNDFDRKQGSVGYFMEHAFSGNWTVRHSLRYIHTDVTYENAFAFGYADAAQTDLLLFGRRSKERLDAITTDNQIEGKFDTGPLRHTLLLGADYQRSMWLQHIGGDFVGTVNVADPDNHFSVDTPPYDGLTYQTQDQIGIYAQDQLAWENWRLVLSGRQDWAFSNVHDRLAETRAKQNDDAFTGRAGLVYLFDSGFAPYVSYATSFQPVAGTDRNGTAFKPTTGEQEEIGIKFQPENVKSFITVSAYNLVQKNVLTTDTVDPTFSTQTGAVRTRGVEVEGKANLADGLNVIAAYSYMDNEVTKATDDTKGKTPVFMPKNTASLWADYTFGARDDDGQWQAGIWQGSWLSGFGIGGGVRFTGYTWGDAANTFKVPSHTLFDAVIGYDFTALSPKLAGAKLSLNVTNIADKRYVSGCTSALFCTYGEGRKILATLNYTW